MDCTTVSVRHSDNPHEWSKSHKGESAPSPRRRSPRRGKCPADCPPASPACWSRLPRSLPAAHGTPWSRPSPPTHTRAKSVLAYPPPSSPPSAPHSLAQPKQTSAPPAAIPHEPWLPPPSTDSCTHTHAAP